MFDKKKQRRNTNTYHVLSPKDNLCKHNVTVVFFLHFSHFNQTYDTKNMSITEQVLVLLKVWNCA